MRRGLTEWAVVTALLALAAAGVAARWSDGIRAAFGVRPAAAATPATPATAPSPRPR